MSSSSMYLTGGSSVFAGHNSATPPSVPVAASEASVIDHTTNPGSSPDSPSSQRMSSSPQQQLHLHHHPSSIPTSIAPPPPLPPSHYHHAYHHHHHLQAPPGSMSPVSHPSLTHLSHHHPGFFAYDPSTFQMYMDPLPRIDTMVKSESDYKQALSDIDSDHLSSDPYHHHHHVQHHDAHSMNGSDPSSPQHLTPTITSSYNETTTQTASCRPVPVRSPYEWMNSSKKSGSNNHTSSDGSQPPPGKTRTRDKYRVVYSDHQRMELENHFLFSPYITIREKAKLAASLALSERQVKIWFQNRRAKKRKLEKKNADCVKKEGGSGAGHCKNGSGNNSLSSSNGTGSNSSNGSISMHHPMYLTGGSMFGSSGTPVAGQTVIDHHPHHLHHHVHRSSGGSSPDSPLSHHHYSIPTGVPPPPPPPPHYHHPMYHHHGHHLQQQSSALSVGAPPPPPPLPQPPQPLSSRSSMSPPPQHALTHLHHPGGIFSSRELFPYGNETSLQML